MILAGLTLAAGSGATAAGTVAAGTVAAGAALIAAGVAAGLPALRRLVPAGTLTARPGLPATILSRGLLTFAFFGADAYVTLAITEVRHRSPLVAGIAVTGATLGWTAGSWVQARLSETWQGRRFVRTGLVIVLAGIAGMVLVLQPDVPVELDPGRCADLLEHLAQLPDPRKRRGRRVGCHFSVTALAWAYDT